MIYKAVRYPAFLNTDLSLRNAGKHCKINENSVLSFLNEKDMDKLTKLLFKVEQLTPKVYPQMFVLLARDGRYIVTPPLCAFGINDDMGNSEFESVEEAYAAFNAHIETIPLYKRNNPVLVEMVSGVPEEEMSERRQLFWLKEP